MSIILCRIVQQSDWSTELEIYLKRLWTGVLRQLQWWMFIFCFAIYSDFMAITCYCLFRLTEEGGWDGKIVISLIKPACILHNNFSLWNVERTTQTVCWRILFPLNEIKLLLQSAFLLFSGSCADLPFCNFEVKHEPSPMWNSQTTPSADSGPSTGFLEL